MLLQAALNGEFTKGDHPALPVSPEELARDATACVAAERLAASGLGDRVTRVLVEPLDPGAERVAVAVVDEIHTALDRLGVDAPRLQHSDGQATWTLIDDAIRRGIDTRVGLEDTRHGRHGELAEGNASLVRDALAAPR